MRVAYLRTVTSIQWLWNQAPQQPKKANTNMVTPVAMKAESALRRAYWGSRDTLVSAASRKYKPAAKMAHPASYDKHHISVVINMS